MEAMAVVHDEYLPWGDENYRRNPYPWYDRVRQERPVYKMADGTYVVTRYDDITKYGKLPIMAIVDPEWVPKGPWTALSKTVLGVDPPVHTNLRRRTNKWFTPKLVQTWVEAAEKAANDALDRLELGQTVEANLELGVVPTHAAMCSALQLPTDNVSPVHQAMLAAMAALSSVASKEDDIRAAEAFAYLRERSIDLLSYKRANPGDGLADALIEAERVGEMTEEEIIQTISLFWGSGGHNPSFFVSSGIEYFARNPDLYRLYRERPDLRSGIQNELLRLNPPELSFVRYPTEDLEIRGVKIKAGERIRFILDAANRDPEVFQDPNILDPHRPVEAAQNLSFGIGPHACAGQVISRAEADTIFKVIADRVERIEMAGMPEYDTTDRSRAYVTLPVKFF
ncbi:cytochrome P450 [Agrobacterium sp. SOY23]|uniref:cytochrome P450 n=1 Tax=Agrobacterium sp. SOY23 TaxID=3014555 RepID=UPI0022AEC041|nr:cytochrome P450 [Agrobacterium sp. SOY23]MCZ4433025.1 cytochrome P450 [Agrobacterium sp. SOY23]